MNDQQTPFEYKRLIEWAKNPVEPPKLPNGTSLEDAFRYSQIGEEGNEYRGDVVTNDMFIAARDEFISRLQFAFDVMPQRPELDAFRKVLQTQDPFAIAQQVGVLKQYIELHPSDSEQHPVLAFAVLMSPKMWAETMLCRNVFKYAHKQLQHRFKKDFKQEYENSYDASPKNGFKLLLGVGHLHPDGLSKAYVMEKTSPEELKEVVQMYREAEKTYGETWRKTYPDKYDQAKTILSDVEWKSANPIFTSASEQEILEKVDRFSLLLTPLAADSENARNYRGGHFSWRYLLKQAWEDEADFEKRFLELPYCNAETIDMGSTEKSKEYPYGPKLFSVDDPRFFIDDPRFGLALFEIGSELIAFDPAFENPASRTPEKIREVAKKAIREWGLPGADAQTSSNIHQVYMREIRQIQWQDIAAFRHIIEEKMDQPGAIDTVASLLPGPYRDILLYDFWKRDKKGKQHSATYFLERLDHRIPDATRANRCPDLLNRYVQSHYVEATNESEIFRKEVVLETFDRLNVDRENGWKQIGERLPWLDDAYTLVSATGEQKTVYWDFKRAHQEKKQTIRKAWVAEKAPVVSDFYLFSSTINQTSGTRTYAEIAYRPNVVVELAKDISDPVELDTFVMRWLKEKCQLRDFFLENALNMNVWKFLEHSSIASELETLGISLNTREIDLEKSLKDKDEGVLSGAYMTKYVLHRVTGLAMQVDKLRTDERKRLSEMLRELASKVTPATAEQYERLAVDLELPQLREQYDETLRDALPRDRAATSAEQVVAQQRAFEGAVKRIQTAFPYPSYYRDGLLESVVLDMAHTPEQAQRIETMTYTYLMRNPGAEKEQGEIVAFSPVETVKNYLAAFQNRAMRSKILCWIFGGELPDDRYLEGKVFGVNADVERESFWALSDEERKVVLYHAMLGEHGLFECPTEKPRLFYSHDQAQDDFKTMEAFLDSFYASNFEPLVASDDENPRMGDALKVIFMETFIGYSSARRVELLCAITRKMGELRRKDEKLTAGQAIRLFLEQIGVVGVKAGQVLAEHAEMVPEKIRPDLSSLRDRAKPFAKFGVFTYLRMAKLFGDKTKASSDFQIASVGECLGSASIKQVHEAVTNTGETVVVKVPRPSIDKYFEEDVRVLGRVTEELRKNNFDVPEYLLPEIVDACRSEFDFEQDAKAQAELGKIFEQREATMRVGDMAMPMQTPKLIRVVHKGETRISNLQLIVEEHTRGLSLSDIESYQKQDEPHTDIETRIRHLYGDRAPQVMLEYRHLDLQRARAQIACDLVQQMTIDGLFQADAHSGNVLIDLEPKHERVEWIDFGSVGRSLETQADGRMKDERPQLRQFIQSLLLVSMQIGDAKPMGEIVAGFVEGSNLNAEEWSAKITEIAEAHPDFSQFFKELTATILSSHGKINRTFKLFLKALAAGGGHFDALAQVVKERFGIAMEQAAAGNGTMREALLEEPGFEKLLPLFQDNLQLKEMLG